MCDPPNQTNCNDQRSVSNSGTEVTNNLQPDNTETPIIIPDISPTDEDLGDTATSGDSDRTDTEVTGDNTDDDSENNIDRNSNGDEDTDSDDKSDDDNDNNPEPSLVPFP